jgi:hypothetical protein
MKILLNQKEIKFFKHVRICIRMCCVDENGFEKMSRRGSN